MSSKEKYQQLSLMQLDDPQFVSNKNGYKHRASLNYIGSKHTLLTFISQTILDYVCQGQTPSIENLTLAEIFAGTGTVAKAFKGRVKHLIVNDLEAYSYILNRNYIGNNTAFVYQPLLDELNALSGTEGLIFRHYCLNGGQGRQYFSDDNGRKIDAIRQQINIWYEAEAISADQYYFLLASLLESADRVANVASVYGAFLKHLKRTAQQPLILKSALFEASAGTSCIYHTDANSLIKTIAGDILYLDPPYNHRQYGANYHLLNTIALYDDVQPKGKTGLRDYEKSLYCSRHQVASAFEDLIAQAQFQYIFLSYNNEGLMSVAQVQDIMSQYGQYDLKTKAYQRFKADSDRNRQHKADITEEYLHILIKS